MIWILFCAIIAFGLYGWWDMERQIKKNIDDMDL
jgi:hypothetical protein